MARGTRACRILGEILFEPEASLKESSKREICVRQRERERDRDRERQRERERDRERQ